MDEGLPIAYSLLEKDVPVRSCDGAQIGTVHHVVAEPENDIFHGVVIATPAGQRFVEAADVESLHEHGVDLNIDLATAEGLPEPAGGAPVYGEDPAEGNWSHWVRRLTLRNDWQRKD